MTLDVHALIAYFFGLIAISSNTPTNIFDEFGQPQIEQQSYGFGYRGNGSPYNAHVQGKVGDPRAYHQDSGHWGNYHRHSYYHNRRYDPFAPQDPRHGNWGETYPHRNHRQGAGEIADSLGRRTIDVGHGEHDQQSLGDGESGMSGINEISHETQSSHVEESKKIIGVNSVLTNLLKRRKREDAVEMEKVTEESGTEVGRENSKETGRAITAGPSQSGGQGGKRPDGGGKGTGFQSASGKPKTPSVQAPKRNSTQNFDFVFPDNPIFLPKSTSCGEGTTFCEKIGDDYPEQYIKEILKKEGDRFREVFGRDSILEMNITERVYKVETDLCASSHRIIFPTKAKNKDNKWQFVINQEGYTQGIGVETCVNAEKPCSMTDGFPLAYRTFCKQKYITRRLLSLNENGGPGMNEFLFPSCCVCILQSVGLSTD